MLCWSRVRKVFTQICLQLFGNVFVMRWFVGRDVDIWAIYVLVLWEVLVMFYFVDVVTVMRHMLVKCGNAMRSSQKELTGGDQ